MENITYNIQIARVFSKLDLLNGCFQVPVIPEGIPKTVIITTFVTYTFIFLLWPPEFLVHISEADGLNSGRSPLLCLLHLQYCHLLQIHRGAPPAHQESTAATAGQQIDLHGRPPVTLQGQGHQGHPGTYYDEGPTRLCWNG